MIVDYHIHTVLCHHAQGEMKEYVNRAIKLGIKELGFSEHSPWMYQEELQLAPDFEDIPLYLSQVRELQEQYTRGHKPLINIRLGFEMDYLPDQVDTAREYSHKIDFDFTIGSVHHIDHWGFDQEQQAHLYGKYRIEEVYEQYFSLVLDMINTGVFDIVGHIDLVKKFGHKPAGGYKKLQEKVASALRQQDMVVELNTSGYDRPIGEPYPGFDFLCVLQKHKVPITLGSDAHAPSEVGRYFAQALELLRSAGYIEIMGFEKRSRFPIKI